MQPFEVIVGTYIGEGKAINGDSFSYKFIERENILITAVADGVSNSYSDAISSKIAIEVFFETFLSLTGANSLEKRLEKSASQANLSLITDDRKQLLTTLTAIAWKCDLPFFFSLNTGDSRLYLINKSNLTQLTKDNTHIVTKKDVDGSLKAREVLSQCIGSNAFNPAIFPKVLNYGDILLLATDGFYRSNDAIDECLKFYNNSIDEKTFLSKINSFSYDDDATFIIIKPN